MHGVLQSTCAKGTARHIVKKHEDKVNSFKVWSDLCDWHEGLANSDNNANHLKFKLDALKLTTRTSADQYTQDFLELKD